MKFKENDLENREYIVYNISTNLCSRYTHFTVLTHKLPVAYNIDSLDRKQESPYRRCACYYLYSSVRVNLLRSVRLVVPGRKLANWVI